MTAADPACQFCGIRKSRHTKAKGPRQEMGAKTVCPGFFSGKPLSLKEVVEAYEANLEEK